MNAMTKLEAAILVACVSFFASTSANAWWDDDDYYDRWDDGPWYGGHRYWGGYPGRWGGYPGYWGGYPGGWGGHPGYGGGKTVIVYPQAGDEPVQPQPAREPPR